MKKTLIGAALAALLLSPTPSQAMDAHEFCSLVSKNARLAMVKRQEGVSMRRLIGAITDMTGPMAELARLAIQDAYSRPRYSSREYQLDAISDFENEWYSDCYERATQ